MRPSSNSCNDPLTAPLTWAQRLKRVFAMGICLRPLCGGLLRVIGDATGPERIRRILDPLSSGAQPHLPPRCVEPHRNLPDLFAGR